MGNVLTEPGIYLSIVIRTRNSAPNLKKVFDALAAQQCSFTRETIVVDNESGDETLELCQKFGAKVFSISRREFTYGRALNLGISNTRGQLIFLCSAHSVPVGSYFLERAVAPFDDPKIAAVRCLVGSYKEQTANWYTARDIQYASLDEQEKAEAGTEWISQYPSATCCVIRRSVWEQIPYDEQLDSCEDKVWASHILSKGFKIRCCTEAVFIYNRSRKNVDAWKYEARGFRALYRVKGYVPLTWPQFFARFLRFFLLAPFVGIRYFVHNVAKDLFLVTVPWQAKFLLQAGSLSEYDKINSDS